MSKNKKYTVVITRAAEQAGGFEDLLKNFGFDTFKFPAIQIRFTSMTEEISTKLSALEAGAEDWLVISSANAVRALYNLKPMLVFPENLKLALIGEKTAAIFKELYKRKADLMPADYTSESLLEDFKKLSLKGKNFLILQGNKNRKLLPDGLKEIGASVKTLVLYENAAADSKHLIADLLTFDPETLLFTFFSPSAVKETCTLLHENLEFLKRSKIVSIGPVTSRAITTLGLKVDLEVDAHTEEALSEQIKSRFQVQ